MYAPPAEHRPHLRWLRKAEGRLLRPAFDPPRPVTVRVLYSLLLRAGWAFRRMINLGNLRFRWPLHDLYCVRKSNNDPGLGHWIRRLALQSVNVPKLEPNGERGSFSKSPESPLGSILLGFAQEQRVSPRSFRRLYCSIRTDLQFHYRGALQARCPRQKGVAWCHDLTYLRLLGTGRDSAKQKHAKHYGTHLNLRGVWMLRTCSTSFHTSPSLSPYLLQRRLGHCRRDVSCL
jgi:hypothetical protein